MVAGDGFLELEPFAVEEAAAEPDPFAFGDVPADLTAEPEVEGAAAGALEFEAVEFEEAAPLSETVK